MNKDEIRKQLENREKEFKQEKQHLTPPENKPKTLGEKADKMLDEGIDGLDKMNINLQELPTGGIFYPEDTKISVRAATVKEIRHYSTMLDPEESPGVNPFMILKDQNDKISSILNKCLTVYMNGERTNYKDLADSDRFYLLFVVREITFKNKNNDIKIKIEDSEGNVDEVKLKPDVFTFSEPKEKLMKFFNSEKRCFVVDTHLFDGTLYLYAPTVGVTNKLLDVQINKMKSGEKFDESIFKLLPFLFDDFRKINDKTIKKMSAEIANWDLNKWSVASTLTKMIQKDMGVESAIKVKHSASGEEVQKQLDFRYNELFLPRNIEDEL